MNIIHFKTAHSWSAARVNVGVCDPILNTEYTAGLRLHCLRIHVCDHKLRELPIGDRTLEAHFGDFVISQAEEGRSRSPTPRIGHTVWQRVYGGANSRAPGARVRTRARTGTG